MTIVLKKIWIYIAGTLCFTALLSAPAYASTGWYASAGVGYTSEWTVDGDYNLAPPGASIAIPYWASICSHPSWMSSISVGYRGTASKPLDYQVEIEGMFSKRRFEERATFPSMPVDNEGYTPPVRPLNSNEYSLLANIGIVASSLPLRPYLMIGMGSNDSNRSNVSTIWQVKAGADWQWIPKWSVGVEVKYLALNDYVLQGDIFPTPYRFGEAHSMSAFVRLAYQF